MAWLGHLHPPLLPKLTSVEIRDCASLKYVFEIPLAQGLPQIKISSGQLQQVFQTEQLPEIESDSGHLQSRLLPKLKSLAIHCCPSVEYVFKIPFAQGRAVALPRLNIYEFII